MNTIIKKGLQSLLLVPVLALGVSVVAPVLQPIAAYAQVQAPNSVDDGINAANPSGTSSSTPTVKVILTNVTNILLLIVGAVSVIMIIYGGFRYITSGGDSARVTSAKNTVLYAVVGLMIAIFAWVIIAWVRNLITGATGNGIS